MRERAQMPWYGPLPWEGKELGFYKETLFWKMQAMRKKGWNLLRYLEITVLLIPIIDFCYLSIIYIAYNMPVCVENTLQISIALKLSTAL